MILFRMFLTLVTVCSEAAACHSHKAEKSLTLSQHAAPGDKHTFSGYSNATHTVRLFQNYSFVLFLSTYILKFVLSQNVTQWIFTEL